MSLSAPRIPSRLLLALALGLGHAAGALAWNETQFEAASTSFRSATQGETAAIAPAAERFAALLQAEPGHPLLLAYAGASTALRATDTWLPWKKLAYAEDGLAQIDKALALLQPAHEQGLHQGVPYSLETRFVAANTFLALPAMFHRGERGARLLRELLADPLLARAPGGFQGSVLMLAARQALREQDTAGARRHYQAVVERALPQAAAAAAALKGLPA